MGLVEVSDDGKEVLLTDEGKIEAARTRRIA
jgi:hypothetical protein